MKRAEETLDERARDVIDLRGVQLDDEIVAAANIAVWALARELPHRRWAIVDSVGASVAADVGAEWRHGAALAHVQLDEDDALLDIVTDARDLPPDGPEAVAARATARLLLAVVASHRRVRQAELAADRAWVAATIDPVTRVSNARGWWDRIEEAAAADPAANLIACFTIVNLSAINDRHGHLHGDLVLRVTAQRVLEQLGPDDILARLAGAHFMVLAHDRDPDELVESIVGAVAVDGVVVRAGVARQQADEPVRATMARADLAQRGGPERSAG